MWVSYFPKIVIIYVKITAVFLDQNHKKCGLPKTSHTFYISHSNFLISHSNFTFLTQIFTFPTQFFAKIPLGFSLFSLRFLHFSHKFCISHSNFTSLAQTLHFTLKFYIPYSNSTFQSKFTIVLFLVKVGNIICVQKVPSSAWAFIQIALVRIESSKIIIYMHTYLWTCTLFFLFHLESVLSEAQIKTKSYSYTEIVSQL